MLNKKERDDCLYSLVNQYIAEQQQNRVYNRESSSAYTFAKGELVGFCTAYQYNIIETPTFVQIESKLGRFLLRMDK